MHNANLDVMVSIGITFEIKGLPFWKTFVNPSYI